MGYVPQFKSGAVKDKQHVAKLESLRSGPDSPLSKAVMMKTPMVQWLEPLDAH